MVWWLRWLAASAALAGCHHPAPGVAADGPAADASAAADASVDSVDGVPAESRRLGLNDVSMLLALPVDPAAPTLATMTGFGADDDLVPRDTFTSLANTYGSPQEISFMYEQFHIVAIRFDLCDRVAPGPCPSGADGQLRLTFQPMLANTPTDAADVALHASYAIPTASMPAVVNELRALSRLQNVDLASPLGVNATLVAGSTTEYATRLRALVATYALARRIVRLTGMYRPTGWAEGIWHARGLELTNGMMVFFAIPTLQNNWPEQDISAVSGLTLAPTFDPSPFSDIPAGFQIALDDPTFDSANATDREQALEAVTANLNPTTTASKTVQCVGCHLSTYLSVLRSGESGIDLATVPGRYTSTHDLSISNGASATDTLSVRAFAWHNHTAEISQRVANDTAMVLDEMEARFPPAGTGP